VGPFSTANPEGKPSRESEEFERTRRVPALRLPRDVDDDSRGFDYFATDLHHLSLAIEIRRRLAARRGFVLLSGPPAPDGKLVSKYLDGTQNREDRAARGQRATLIECKPEWTFGDVVIACSRELGLGPDAGALPILSQVRREQRKGLMRMLVLENGDCLEDEGFLDLRRFARIDGPPDVLPVVLLVSSRFAERLESGLRALKQEVVASLPMQRLLPGEVAAFIGYQIEPMGGRGGAAFAPETIAAIAEASQGDPRMVNRLIREDLGLLSQSRGPTLAIPTAMAEVEAVPVAQTPAEAAPAAEMTAAETTGIAEMLPVMRPHRPKMARLAHGLAAAAALLVVGIYASGFIYLMAPGAPADIGARSVEPRAASLSVSTAPAPPVVAPTNATAPAAAAPSGTEPVAGVGSSETASLPTVPVAAPEPRAAPAAAAAVAATETARPSAAAPSDAPPAVAVAESTTPAAPSGAAVALPEPEATPAATGTTAAATAPAPPAPAVEPPSPAPIVARDAPAQTAAIEPSAAQPGEVSAAAPAAPAPTATSDSASAGEAARLLMRADQLLALGDMASAREFFELAADAGDATASYRLGQTYDPLFLRQAAVRGVAADPAKAAAWYRRAAQGGSGEAAQRLAQLEGKDGSAAGAVR
jgi:TPR repeat protein